MMDREEIEELVVKIVKEQNGRVMPRLRYRASHPFTSKILVDIVSLYLENPQIDCYKGEADPVEHIQRHRASFRKVQQQ